MTTTDVEQKHLNDLVNNCIAFADRKGRVIHKSSNPVAKHLSMEYKGEGLEIFFKVFSTPYGNGSCDVKVTQNGAPVLEAEGSFMAYAFNTKATTYVKGDWENKIPKWEH